MHHNFLDCEHDRNFAVYTDVDIIVSARCTPIFSSDVTMISYFNITFNKSIITDSTFSRDLNIFFIFFIHNKFLLWCLFITQLQYLITLALLQIKLWPAFWPKYHLKVLLNWSSTHTNLKQQLHQTRLRYFCV